MTASSRAHATLMSIVRAEATAHKLIDIGVPECSFGDREKGRFKRISLDDRTPALIFVGNCYCDEWICSISLWPRPDAEEYAWLSQADERAGEVFALGWLNRWQFHTELGKHRAVVAILAWIKPIVWRESFTRQPNADLRHNTFSPQAIHISENAKDVALSIIQAAQHIADGFVPL